MVKRHPVGVPDVEPGPTVLRGKGFQKPDFALYAGMPPKHLDPLGLLHDEDPIGSLDHVGRQGARSVPAGLHALFPEDGCSLRIGSRAPEIEQAGRSRLNAGPARLPR